MVKKIILVIGSGSIAKRHIMNLKNLFPSNAVGCLSSSGRLLTVDEMGCDFVYSDFAEALKFKPYFAIIASPATHHIDHAHQLLSANIPVLIEKPLSSSLNLVENSKQLLWSHKDKIEIAYNLRYLPACSILKKMLDEKIIGTVSNVLIDVGQYLPEWRLNSDYTKTVSAQKALGGGVLLELSHDLDYSVWLFGQVEEVYCVMMNTGQLVVDVEDNVSAIIKFKNGPLATVHMDFLQRFPSRTCKIIGTLGTIIWDVLNNTIVLYTSTKEVKTIYTDSSYNKNDMYLHQLIHFEKMVSLSLKPRVGLEHAFYILYLVEALKRSAQSKQSIFLDNGWYS
ncbi:MAG: Gfo/Idh/MocA family oxidoreductase [bacterium]|nr:Gfo/Idh/MocA family oxidoreductase [bacterium]